MSEAPLPPDESSRLAALRELQVLDTLHEERFDRITRTAARLFDVPTALVTLVDVHRQWFKSSIGLSVPETPRSMSFCAHAILQDAPLVIPDAQLDPRFVANPLVTGDPHIRFYAGQPLRGPGGYKVGTLCLIDSHAREFSEGDLQALRDLAIWAETELNTVELRQALRIQRESEERVRAVMDSALDGIITVDEAGTIWTANPAEEHLTGYSASELVGMHFSTLLRADAEHPIPRDALSLAAGDMQDVVGRVQEMLGRRKDGSLFPLEVAVSEFQRADRRFFVCVTRDTTERKEAEAGLRLRDKAIAAARNGIVITDVQAGDNPIVSTNPAFTAITGYRMEEAVGRNCRFLQGPGTDRAALAEIRAAIEQRRPCLVTLVNYRKDGTPFWQELSISPMHDTAGQLTHFIGVQSDVSERIAAEDAIRRQNELLESRVQDRTRELEEAQIEIVERLALAAEHRDDDTGAHTYRVAHLSVLIARRLGWQEREVELLRRASMLHDVGKIGIPDSVLLKPGKLTDDEFAQMKTHTTIGAHLLSGSRHPLLQRAQEIALSHQERWDGSGYPAGLAGSAIPLAARILAVVDVFDALTHARPYKPAWSQEDALAEIERQSGRHFDPAVLEAFLHVIGTGKEHRLFGAEEREDPIPALLRPHLPETT